MCWTGASGWKRLQASKSPIVPAFSSVMTSGMGTWQDTMTLFYSLEQVVSSKEGTFPENMLFQGLLIPECSKSHRETLPGFRARGCGERAQWGCPPFCLPPAARDLHLSSCKQTRWASHLCTPASCGRGPGLSRTG